MTLSTDRVNSHHFEHSQFRRSFISWTSYHPVDAFLHHPPHLHVLPDLLGDCPEFRVVRVIKGCETFAKPNFIGLRLNCLELGRIRSYLYLITQDHSVLGVERRQQNLGS